MSVSKVRYGGGGGGGGLCPGRKFFPFTITAGGRGERDGARGLHKHTLA